MMGEKWCEDCSHYTNPPNEEPCKSCTNHSNWASAHVTIDQFNALAEQVRELQELALGYSRSFNVDDNAKVAKAQEAYDKIAAHLQPAPEPKHELIECGRDRNGTMIYKGDNTINEMNDILTALERDPDNSQRLRYTNNDWDNFSELVLWERSPENAAALKKLEESNATA